MGKMFVANITNQGIQYPINDKPIMPIKEGYENWTLLSHRIYSDHFLDSELEVRPYMISETKDESDIFIHCSLDMALGIISNHFDISEWYSMIKPNLHIGEVIAIDSKEEYLELQSKFKEVFVRLNGCSAKDGSLTGDCIYPTTSQGYDEAIADIKRSERCTLFQERCILTSGLANNTLMVRPVVQIELELRCIVIDQVLRYVIPISGSKWQSEMLPSLQFAIRAIIQSLPWDNVTVDMALIDNDPTHHTFKLVELNCLLHGITGLGQCEGIIDLSNPVLSYYEPIIYLP